MKNKDVRAFAEGMLSDHTAMNKKALDLVKKLKVTPEDNDTGGTVEAQRCGLRQGLYCQ
jgi:putative membrane protein